MLVVLRCQGVVGCHKTRPVFKGKCCMALSTDLLTNEVKNRAGTEIEFVHRSLEGRTHEYAQSGAAPNLPVSLKIAHSVTGVGIEAVRRSVVRIDKAVIGASAKKRTISGYKVIVAPEGDIADLNDVKDVSAMLDSFCSTTGAGTTVLFDGSGNGDSALINGTV